MFLYLLLGGVATVVFAALVYPGELSLFGPRANRWLYDRSAQSYQEKWRSAAYEDHSLQERIDHHVAAGLNTTGLSRVLDLGCGTGRALQLSDFIGRSGVHYTGIDFSREMLAGFRRWLETEGRDMAERVELREQELGLWAAQENNETFGAVFFLEVGEFLPGFIPVVHRISSQLPPGGALVMTRPAKLWWIFFPRRKQSRRALALLLQSAGFEAPEYVPWRNRYELVLTRKAL